MATFENVSNQVHNHPGLNVCIESGETLSVLYWQCKGALQCNKDGVVESSTEFLTKAKQFVALAHETKADLVLTPEYSFPMSLLAEIVDNKEHWPISGKLWCLCMQGQSLDSFKEQIAQWKRQAAEKKLQVFFNIVFKEKTFVDPLIYLFISASGDLCILPQLKTGPMADKWSEFEDSGLSLGDKIYVFDLHGLATPANNVFLSLICADGLYITGNKILELPNQGITIFHPQLNDHPRHSVLIGLRRHLFSYDHGKKIRYMTLNWSEGTTAILAGKKEPLNFNVPWSAYYLKPEICEIRETIKLRNTNHLKATFYAHDGDSRTDIWFHDREEHCKLMEIRKAVRGGGSLAATSHPEPITKNRYMFDIGQMRWVDSPPYDNKQLKDLIEPLCTNTDYKWPLTATPSDCDYFFGACLGHFADGEVATDPNEMPARIIVGADEKSDKIRRYKVGRFKNLVAKLKSNAFPETLSYLKNSHEFAVDSKCCEIMHSFKTGNLRHKDDRQCKRLVLVVITEDWDDSDVDFLADKIMKDLKDEDERKRFFLYCRDKEGESYMVYDKHLSATDVAKAEPIKNLASFLNFGKKWW